MKNRIELSIAACLVAVALGGCAGLSRNENTALGAVAGGVAGSALTGGSTAGTVGGAVVGGVVGHESGRR